MTQDRKLVLKRLGSWAMVLGIGFSVLAGSVAQTYAASADHRYEAAEFVFALRKTINALAIARGGERVTGELRPEVQKIADQGTFADYPFREDPAALEDFFSPEFNLPAKVVGFWTVDYLRRQLEGSAARELKEKIDLQLFFELSLEASSLWDRMLTCADGDPEVARAAYRDGSCLRAELTEFHGRVFNFLQTTDIAETLQYYHRANPDGVIEMHPLLLQIFEEIVAVWFPTENNVGKLRKWGRKNTATAETSRTGRNIVKLLPLLPRFTSTPIGLWPTATRAVHAYYFGKFFLFGSSFALHFGPAEEFFRTPRLNPAQFVLVWGNPIIWLIKLFGSAHVGIEGMKKIEPTPMDMSTKWSVDDYATEAGLARAAEFPKVVLEFRKISKHYGFDRKDIFR